MQQVHFGTTVISYDVQYSEKRKSLGIQVSEAGVNVVAPINTPLNKIDEIVLNKAPWILTQLAEFEEMNQYEEKLRFLSGEKLPYLGRNYRLKVYKEAVDTIQFSFKQGKFIAVIPSHIDEADHGDMLYPLFKQWVIEHAMKIASERVKRFGLIFDLMPSAIKIKDQQQRWGSCTASGNVILNWKVFLAPMPIVDYVIAHELAHLKVMDHSEAFWRTLEMLCPGYKEQKEWLRLNGRRLHI